MGKWKGWIRSDADTDTDVDTENSKYTFTFVFTAVFTSKPWCQSFIHL